MARNRLIALVLFSCVAAGAPLAITAQPEGGERPASQPAADLNAVCIPQGAKARVDQCPANAPRAKMGKAGAPQSRLRTADRRTKESKNKGPTGPSIELSMAERMNRERVQARAEGLLQREVQILRRLVQNTRTEDARRPDILLRLAETYFEQQTALNARVRGFDDPIHQACVRQKNAANCRQQRQGQQQAQSQLDGVRQEAIRTYATLVQDHPNYRRMDEVLFALAFSLDEMRQHDRARQVYHRLIKNYPQSRFIPHAYLSFAEFYFGDGSDMAAAGQFYTKVTEFPPERNPVYGYALYKLAWVHYNLEDMRASLEAFVRVIEFGTQNPEARDAANLVRQSRRELVLPYAQVGTPQRALEFFQRYAENREQALEMLESLGELYFDTGQWDSVLAVYHKLMAESPNSDQVCYWQTRVTNAIISSRPKPEQVTELERMIDVYAAFAAQNRPAESVNLCKQETATLLVWLATAWHREAIGTDTQPGTNDRNTMDLAARLYRLVLDRFPDMESMQFPDIDRRDWPTQYKVSYYYAELLWKMERWDQCGPAFDAVVELNPQGEYTADAAYAAVLCYNNLYQQQYSSREREVRGGDAENRPRRQPGRRRRGQPQEEEAPPENEFAPRDFTALETGMENAFRRYVCFVPDSEDLPTIKYRRARIYYESNHFEEAAYLFRDIAWNHRDSDLAVYAANLYLDSLNVMGSRIEPHRTSCILEIKDSIEPLFGFYCNTDENRSAHEELCQVLEQLRCDVLRKEAEAYHSNGQFRRAASTYVRIFRQYQECGQLDEVLWNAAIDFEAARLLGRAIQVRNVLIERYPESNYSKRAIYLIGANFHAIASYENAATFYERFAERYAGEDGSDCTEDDRRARTCAIAHEALQNALFFRMGLGPEHRDQAIEDADLFARNYGRRMPREVAQVQYSIGAIYERERNWRQVISHYQNWLRRYRRGALPQHVVQANVLIGRAYWETNDKNRARGPFEAAVRAYQSGTAEAIAALEGVDDATRARHLLDAKSAASEALFYLAEYSYDAFRAIEFPRYRGPRTNEGITEWSRGEFAEWVTRKTAALTAAEGSYNRIAELEVPAWMIAGAARIGEMYRSFVDEFRDAPIPQEIETDDELRDIYYGRLDEVSEPLVRQAIDKFEFCIRTSTNVRWFNRWSRQCEQELHRLNPREYPLAAELRSTPGYINSTLAVPRLAELVAAEEGEEEAEGGGGGGGQGGGGQR